MKIYGITFLISCLFGVSFWQLFPGSEEKNYSWVEAQEKQIAPALIERGIVEAGKVALVQTFTSGTILDLKKKNDRVKKGDVVASIDTSNYDDDIAEIEVDLEAENLALEANKRRVVMVEKTERNRMSTYKKLWEHAVLERDYELSLPEKGDLRKLEINLELKKLDLEEAEYNLKRQTNLYNKGFVSKVFLETYERRFATAREKVNEAELNIAIAKKGITDERRVTLEQRVLRSKASFDRAEKRLLRRIEEYTDIVRVSEQKIRELKFKRDNLMDKLDKSTCYAEQDGYVLIKRYKDYRAGGQYKTYAPGVGVRERDVIAYIINPSNMKISAIFNESDYHKLKSGMAVEVSFPSFPGKTFQGKLKSIGAIGKDRNLWLEELSGKSGVSMYNAEIEFDSGDIMLHPGMSAIIKISLEAPRQGTVIPRSSVIHENGSWYVIKESGRTAVEGRVINEFEFEVTQGLNKGEKVRAYPKGDE